ncbi:alcohol dehydrogenase catalytic domain-containing protein [Loigolactobacillus bifermentans]|uniref:Oxidoreductase n=1 Tax=Loigolactobacillus bifermentans DSM 20003 TaxID=1423726 RepID=A0A0R1GM32_9LACO|nr:zinc-binding dehydrogenase [Loigolactobacillus bifermentans]KRK32993.1 oxidoreductase [Loigolactobacillus bifermentans DSM 20003]QGG61368.1 zinc-binding dehydrogenase [Loigolactobacillus bifermentans]
MKALYFNEFGGNEVLQYGTVATPVPGADDVLVQVQYAGLNFADIYRRRGTYHLEPHTPHINGYEGLGTVAAVGENVTHYQVGAAVFFVDTPLAQAEYVVVPESHALPVPTDLAPETIAAIGLQGLTADFLAHDLGQNQPGQRVLVQGISGGVGQLLLQILVADGLQVDGITSTATKQTLALQQGATQVFLRQNLEQGAQQGQYATVYDGVGRTLPQSLKLVQHRGKVVFFGMAGGNPPALDPIALLNVSKSLLTGDLWDYLTSYQARFQRSQRLLTYLRQGALQVAPPTIIPLQNGAQAYAQLESGHSHGKILLQVAGSH